MDEKSNYTENLKQVLFLAEKLAWTYGSSYIASEHLLFAMLVSPQSNAYKILSAQGIKAENYDGYFSRTIDENCNLKGFTPRTKHIIQNAEEMCDGVTKTEHLLLSITESYGCIAIRILRCMGADMVRLAKDIEYYINSEAEQ